MTRIGLTARVRASSQRAVEPPVLDGLSATLRRGAAYSVIAMVAVQVISLAQTLALANLLTKDELGLYIAGTVLTGFLVSVSEGGLRGALVQRETDVARAADTVFWVSGGTGLLLALGALAVAPVVAWWNSSAAAGHIAAAAAGTLLIHSLTNVPDGLLQRQLDFRRRLVVDPAKTVVYAGTTVGLAAAGFGVWSQVIGNYAAMLTWLLLTWGMAGWVPGFARPSYRLWREMARYAFPLMLEGVMFRIQGAVETLIVGKAFSLDALTQKQYAQRLALLPGNALVQVGSYVLFPAMARLAAEPVRLANAFRRALQWSWIGAVAVAGLTIAVGAPTVVLLFGAGYHDAGLAFVAMAGFGLGVALQAAGSEVIKATGHTRLLNWTTAASITFGIGLLVLLLPLGLVGVGLAVSATELLVGVIVLVLTTRVLAVPAAQLFRVLAPPLLAGAAATAIVMQAGSATTAIDLHTTAWMLVTIAADTSLFVLLFGAGMVLLAPSLVRRAISSVIRHIYRRIAPADGIERRDRELDRPTVLIPIVGPDDSPALRAYGNEEWVSPVARTLPLHTIEETHRHDR